MTPLEIYTIAGGDWLRGNLNAIAAFMGTATWSSIEKMCIAFSVLIVAVSWVKKHNIMDLVGWVFSLTLVSMLVVVRTPVQIIDYSNVAQVYKVDNVPVGLAIPASLTTRVGNALVQSYEMIFSLPTVSPTVRPGCCLAETWWRKAPILFRRTPKSPPCSPTMSRTA